MKSIVFILFLAPFAFSGRPLKSNDAFTLGKDLFQIEAASDFYFGEDEFTVFVPATLTFGLSDNDDLFLGSLFLPRAHAETGLPMEFIEAGIKHLVVNAEELKIALAGGLTTAAEEGKLLSPAVFMVFIASSSFNILTLHFNAGYSQNFSENEYSDIWFTSVAAEVGLTERLTLAAELGAARDPLIDSKSVESYSLAGFSYAVSENFAIDTGFNISLHHATKMDLITAGITLVL